MFDNAFIWPCLRRYFGHVGGFEPWKVPFAAPESPSYRAYFFNTARSSSMGSARTVRPLPVVSVARNSEL
jgi:hypothetical protein